MKVIDPGHEYELAMFDRLAWKKRHRQRLKFVKRTGEGFPGNTTAYAGTQTQEVLRALIDRTKYVDNQIPCHQNQLLLQNLRAAIVNLEERAWERHGLTEKWKQFYKSSMTPAEEWPVNSKGHTWPEECPRCGAECQGGICQNYGCEGDFTKVRST